jgi:sialic acid synthase SpsE
MGKQLVAACDMPEGHVVKTHDIAIKSPVDTGLPPYEYEKVIGHVTTRDLLEDEPITWDVLKIRSP